MKNKLFLFTTVLFSISIVSVSLFKLLGGSYQTVGGTIFASLYMFIPMVSVIILQLLYKEPVLQGLNVSFKINRWFFVGWLLMPLFSLSALACSTLIPGVSFSTETPLILEALEKMSEQIPDINAWSLLAITLVSGLSAGITINALFAFGEEICWRGWLLKQFEGQPFFKTSAIIGAIWGLWHFPLILMGHNYPEHPIAGVGMMILFCISFTPIIMYIRIKAKSVIAAAIVHGTLNAIAGISVIYLENTNDLLTGPCGFTGIVVCLLISTVLRFFDPSVMKGEIKE
ncbi:MAG: CPBP family intramembrane metalloprotease [Bacteroidales bacterium]|nr:CPBP family intramembrane metalloprotease [Bacteroidales bacterium]